VLEPVLLTLAIGAALANAVATVWPSLRYAAVTAAIVTLDPAAGIGGGVASAAAILTGTSLGAVTSVVWPVFGRQRASEALQATIDDCQALLEAITARTGRPEREALHARFLDHLQSVQARIAETRFGPALPGGAQLRDAALTVEIFWHTLVLLDRVLSDERYIVDTAAIERLQPEVERVRHEASAFLARVAAEIETDYPTLPHTRALRTATRAACQASEDLDRDHPGVEGVHALTFALGEIERRLEEFDAIMHELPE
jgi:hypothetical protein